MSEPVPTPTPPEPEPEPTPEEEARYTVGSWSGQPNYQCTRCKYATLASSEEDAAQLMDEHWRMAHAPVVVWPAAPGNQQEGAA